jgi:hypothetical protein
MVNFMSFTSADFDSSGLSQSSRVKSRSRSSEHTALLRRLEVAMNVADDLEQRLEIEQWWEPDDVEYQKIIEFIKDRQFIRTVNELEGMVVQWLFELSKANLAGTGNYILPSISLC